MKEKLQILEAQIRKDLPRLMQLGDGCYIRLADHIKTSDPNNIIKMVNAFTFKKEDIVEIIGHDILLSDVLEWLKIKQLFIDDVYVDFDGYFGLLDMAYEKFKCLKVNWNLSKLYLKDQSEELIEFLYNLI